MRIAGKLDMKARTADMMVMIVRLIKMIFNMSMFCIFYKIIER